MLIPWFSFDKKKQEKMFKLSSASFFIMGKRWIVELDNWICVCACTMYIYNVHVQCTLYNVQCTMYIVHSAHVFMYLCMVFIYHVLMYFDFKSDQRGKMTLK